MPKILISLLLLSLTFFSRSACAENLKDQLSELKILPVEYGTNYFTLRGTSINISRTELPSEVAGYGDVYIATYQQDKKWKLVQYQDHKFSTITWPHTEEDPVSVAYFLVPEKTKDNDLESLHLLKADRVLASSIPSSRLATLKLYHVQNNPDFDFMEFQETASLTIETRHCHIELDLIKDFNLKLPNDVSKNSECPE